MRAGFLGFPFLAISATLAAACSAPSSGKGNAFSNGPVDGGRSVDGGTGSAVGFLPGSGSDAAAGGTTGSGATGSGGGAGAAAAAGSGTGAVSGNGGASGGGSGGGGGGSADGAAGGSAGAGGCAARTADCNGNPSDGCEIDIGSDVNNCGACANVCAAVTGATPYCFVGTCKGACATGLDDCNGDKTDGCEAHLLTDPANCGACGMSCGTSQCQGGACQCATTSTIAQRVPLDMYVLFDQSGSMNENVTGGTKWNVIVGALTSFVNNGGSAGIGVGIGYFPISGGGGTCFLGICLGGSSSCNVADYATPSVPIGLLPGVATSITGSFTSHGPGGGTPTLPAMQGAMQYVVGYQIAHPQRKTILVLATDGDPNDCGSNAGNVAGVAAAGLAPTNGNPSILTFVIGVGSSLTSLNGIASAGGTGSAFIVDTAGADPGGQFLAAMNKIRGSAAVGCQYLIPQPPSGPPDYAKVNVQFTPSAGGTPTLIHKVTDVSACTTANGGWYYDNPTTPSQVILCDSTCSAANADPGASISVLLGCTSSG